MAQVQQIYARLFSHIDVATSLLLKQDLVDAEFAYCSIIRQDASSRRQKGPQSPNRLLRIGIKAVRGKTKPPHKTEA
jgi:hypothetical protein